jgi:acyl carrier protein
MDEEILQRVIKVFAAFKKVSPDTISADTTFDELGFDSLDGLNLIFELEEEFGIMIPDSQVKEMKSVKDAAEGVEYLLAHPDEQANAVPAAPPTA